MSKINEAEFRDNAKNNAIRKVRVVPTPDGFILWINLTWKDGEFTLFTQRNHPRTWASVDRMIRYLRRNQLKLTSIELQLK